MMIIVIIISGAPFIRAFPKDILPKGSAAEVPYPQGHLDSMTGPAPEEGPTWSGARKDDY